MVFENVLFLLGPLLKVGMAHKLGIQFKTGKPSARLSTYRENKCALLAIEMFPFVPVQQCPHSSLLWSSVKSVDKFTRPGYTESHNPLDLEAGI